MNRKYIFLALVIATIVFILANKNTEKIKQFATGLQVKLSPDNVVIEEGILGIPPWPVLKTMDLETASELYHRYLNQLQILCPVKQMYGGVRSGFSLCSPLKPPNQNGCSVFLISLDNAGKEPGPIALQEIEKDYKCEVQQFGFSKFMEGLKNKNNEDSVVKKFLIQKTVDAVIVDASFNTSVVLQEMLREGLLNNVNQLIISLNTTNDNTTLPVYVEQLLLMRDLFMKGFRVHTYRRIFACIYKYNIWRTGGYVLSMIRKVATVDPPFVIPSDEKLKAMTPAVRERLYHQYMISTNVLCRDIVRVGHVSAGGWDTCNDTEYRLPKNDCLVYSFGIARDWTFDDEVARRYGCEVHSFDPTINKLDHDRSKNVHFHNMGLGGVDKPNDKKIPVMTLYSIKEKLGHLNRKIHVLKVDIEFAEWSFLQNALKNGTMDNVMQFHLETHHGVSSIGAEMTTRLGIIRTLQERGFRLFSSNPNRYTINLSKSMTTKRLLSSCYEIYFVNINAKNDRS